MITLAHKNIHKLQKHKMTHTGEKTHKCNQVPPLRTRTKLEDTNEDMSNYQQKTREESRDKSIAWRHLFTLYENNDDDEV